MKILLQESNDRDVVGVANALLQKRHELVFWSKDKGPDIKEVADDLDLAIFSNTTDLGRQTFTPIKKKTKVLFLKCDQPDAFKHPGSVISSLPYCADEVRFPPNFPEKKYECDLLYYCDGRYEPPMDIINSVPKDITFRIVGQRLDTPHYIGMCRSPLEVSKLCLSAKLCLDYNFESGLDLARIGCNVITNRPNDIGMTEYNQDNFAEVIRTHKEDKRPVFNPFEEKIISFSHFLKFMFETLDIEMEEE